MDPVHAKYLSDTICSPFPSLQSAISQEGAPISTVKAGAVAGRGGGGSNLSSQGNEGRDGEWVDVSWWESVGTGARLRCSYILLVLCCTFSSLFFGTNQQTNDFRRLFFHLLVSGVEVSSPPRDERVEKEEMPLKSGDG